MRNIFFYTIGIGFTSGIFIRSFFDIGMSAVMLLMVIGAVSLCAWKCIRIENNLASPLFLLALAGIAVSFGVWRMEYEEHKPSLLSTYEGEEVLLVGRIVREPEERETNMQLVVLPTGLEEPVHEKVLVVTDRFQSEAELFSYGDSVEVRGVLKVPEQFASDEGRMFDYPGYLKARGVSHVVSFADVSIQEEEIGTFLGGVFRGKHAFVQILEEHIPLPYAGLAEGLLLGVKRALGEDLEKTFRETGIIHIVVLSGYNIMIVVACVMYVLSFFFRPKTRMVVGLSVIVLFAILVGLSATVVRASVMAGLLIVAHATGRIYAVTRALVLAGVVMLLFNPYLLVHDPGFQLSFLATLALIIVAPHIETRIVFIPMFLGMRKILTATIATQIFVLPLILYHMGLLSIVSVIVNALVLPMVPVAMLLTFLTGVVGGVSEILGLGVGYLAYLSLGYIIFIATVFGSLSFAAFTIGAFPFWIVCIAYACFALMIIYLRGREIERVVFKEVMKKDTEENDYRDWTIEEEIQTSPEVRSTSGDVSKFPLR